MRLSIKLSLALLIFYVNLSKCDKKEPITFDEMINHAFALISPNASWISDHELMFTNEQQSLAILDARTLNSTFIMDVDTLKAHDICSYQMSTDGSHLLFSAKIQPVFRYTFTAVYLMYNLKTQQFSNLLEPTEYNVTEVRVQFAKFGPVGTQVVFGYGNDLYYKPHIRATPVLINPPTRGVEGKVVFSAAMNEIL